MRLPDKVGMSEKLYRAIKRSRPEWVRADRSITSAAFAEIFLTGDEYDQALQAIQLADMCTIVYYDENMAWT